MCSLSAGCTCMSITLTNSGSPMRPTRSSPATGVADRAWVKLPDPVLRCRDALRVASPCLRRPLLARCVTKKGQLKSGRNAQTGYMFLVQGHKALSGRVATWHPGTACPSGDPTNVSAEKIRASPCSPARQGAEQGPYCCVKAETEMRSAPSEARSSEGSQTSSGEWHWGRSQASTSTRAQHSAMQNPSQCLCTFALAGPETGSPKRHQRRRSGPHSIAFCASTSARLCSCKQGATSPSLAYRDLRDSYPVCIST